MLLFLLLASAIHGQERVAILNSVDTQDSIKFNDLSYLTTKIRETAVNVLPKERYGVMTTESIVAFLGSQEKAMKLCNESTCIAEIGRKVSSDYVGQARVGRFGGELTVNFEIYNSKSGTLMSSFSGNSKTMFGLLVVVNEKSPELFKKMLDTKNTPKTLKKEISKSETKTSVEHEQIQNPVFGSFIDKRDGKAYKSVKIGKQIWMAENLNHKGGRCYGENGGIYRGDHSEDFKISKSEAQANCAKYGRLYTWSEAMGLPSGCDTEGCYDKIKQTHKGICPSGWHLPTENEWMELVEFAKKESVGQDAKYLKSVSGWKYENGVDKYGFNALPVGKLDYDTFSYFGEDAYFWSATSEAAYDAKGRVFVGDGVSQVFYDRKKQGLSVRCLLD